MLKFLRTFAMAAAMMLPFAMQAQQSWTVADGTTTHALVPLDFYNCDGSGNHQAQMLYPASLLTEMDGATIGTVKLYHQNTGSKTVTASTWYLRMGETSEADLSSGFSSETLTTVYSGNLVITGGVMTFELTTPYTYNGGNLIVEIQTSGATGNWFGSGSQGCYGVDNAGSTYSTMSSPNYTAFVPKATFTEVPSCFPVTGLAIDATQTTTSSLTLTWTDANNSGASYDIYMVTPTDTTPLDNTTTTSYTATGLNANTTYVFGVVSNCGGGDMAQMVAVSGRTACGAIATLPYTMGFEQSDLQGTTNALLFPFCWTRINTSTSTSYNYFPYAYNYGTPINGSRHLYFSAYSSSYYADTTGFVMPALDVETYPMNGNRVVFWAKVSSSSSPYTVLVGTMTDPSDRSTFTLVESVSVATTTATKYTVSLASATATDAYVAFIVPKVTSSMYIDDVTLEELPSCGDITSVQIAGASTESITLSWTAVAGANGYTIYDMADNSVLGTATDTTYTVTGLDANTAYTFGVQSNCAGGDGLIATVSGRTACAPFSAPYTWNFEDMSTGTAPICWSKLTGGSANVTNGSSDTYYHSASNYLQFSGVAGNNILVLPETEDEISTLQLRFWTRPESTTNSSCGTFSVGYITDAADATTFVAVETYTYSDFTAYEEKTVTFATAPAGARMAMRHDATSTSWYWRVDDVTIEEAPECLPVSGLTASNVAGRTATLTWNGDADGYTIYDMRDTSVYQYATDTTVVLYALDPVTAYTFGVAANCGGDESDMRTVSFTTTISCPAPTALSATLTQGNGTVATLSWHEVGEAAEWQICIDNDMENLIDVTDSVYEMTGLTPEQAITAKVRAICGADDTSAWSSTITFTPTDAYSITVNDGTTISSYVPFYGLYVDEGNQSQFVIPAADLSAMQWGSITKLTFHSSDASITWSGAVFEVYLSETEATGVSSMNAVSDMTQVYTGSLSIVNNKMEVTLATPYQYMGGNLLVAFEEPTTGSYVSCSWYGVTATGASMSSYSDYDATQRNFLPKMTIDYTPGEEPTCFPVSGLAVSGITADEATLTWTGDASSYNVYSISGADTTLVENVSDATITLTGLDAMTQYTYGVRAACGSDESDIRTVVFNTACGAVELPYTETFAAASATRDCWNLVSNNTANVGGNYGMGFVTVGGRNVMRFSSYSQLAGGTYDQYGFSPLMNVSDDATNLQVKVIYGTYGSSDQLFFGYVTANDTVWDPTPYTTNGSYSASDWQSQTFVIPATATQLAVHYYGNYQYYAWVDSVVVTEMTADYCFPVSDLTVDAAQTTTESITLNWVSDGSSFTVLDMADSSIIGTTTDTFMVINNLEASSRYTFGVVNNCGSGDSDTVTVEARTACSAFALPYTEDFENGIDCWSLESCASGTNVVEGASYAYTGTHAFKFNYNTNPPQYLISPELTGGENGVQVSLMYKTTGSYPESFALGYSTTTNETGAFTWLTEQTGLTNTTYEAYTDYLPAGTKYVAVKYTANDMWALYIDSMAISPMSANFCFPVTGLAVDTATGNSVTISWTGDAASYDVYNGTALVGSTTDTFYTVSGLTASTAYTFGVQAICSASDSSDMVTIAAMTDCEGGSCTITIVGTDEYGDGWEDSYIDIQQNGGSIGHCTVEGDPWAEGDYPATETYTYTVCAGVPVTFTWVNGGGNYDYEASFVIKNGNDSVIYTASDASELTDGSVFYTANNVCGSDEPQPHPQVEEATIDASAVTYWVGTGNNQVVMAVNWADTALAWGVNFSTDSITSQDVLDIIAANDPRFSWDTGSYGLGNITFTENGTTHTGDATHFWESKRNTISDMGLYQNLGNGDFQKWANSAAGEVVDSMEYSGVWYYMYNYPMTIYPVTAPQPGPQPADSISVTYTVNDAVMGTITPNGTIRQAVGDSVIATATANDGYRLQGWRFTIMVGDQVASDTTYSLVQPSVFFGTIPQNFATYGASITVTAIFEAGAPDSVEVTYTVNDATMGSINPSGTVMTAVGTQLSATATANDGYELYAWVLSVMLADQVVDSDTIMTNETSYVFGSLPQTFADYNATVIITALFQQQVGIEDADIDNVNVYSANSTIYVRGAEGKSVYVFDVNGRMLNHEAKASENCDFRMENTGVYLVKVGNAAAQRVLVVR